MDQDKDRQVVQVPTDPWQRYVMRELQDGRLHMKAMQSAINENAGDVKEIRTQMDQNTAATVATKRDTEELLGLWRDIKGTVRVATGVRSFMVWIGGVVLSIAGGWAIVEAFFTKK